MSAKTITGVIARMTHAPSVNFTTAKMTMMTAETVPESQFTITL